MSAPAQNTLPAPADHRHAHVVIGIDRRRPRGELGDHLLVERIADVGAVQREVLDDAVAARVSECLV